MTMPSLSSTGWSSELSRLMIGRSWRNRPTLWPNWRPKHSISFANPNSSAFGQTFATWSVPTPGPHQLDRGVDPLAGLLVGVALGVGRLADHERPVVAGLVADERVDDVEEGLVAGPDDPVAEHVRVRAAALARDRVDVVDVLRAEVEQELRHVGDELALADARLELLGEHLVGAVDHRAGRVEQHDLVDRLDLAGVEHHLLGVADGDPLGLERGDHRRLDDVDAERHVQRRPRRAGSRRSRGRPAGTGRRRAPRRRAGRPSRRGCSPGRSHGQLSRWCFAAEPKSQMCGRAAAGLERVAGHLVARPLADVGARDVADVVEVEQQHGAEVGRLEGRLGAAEAVRAEAVGVDPLLPVDGHRAGRRERPHRILPCGLPRRSALDRAVH